MFPLRQYRGKLRGRPLHEVVALYVGFSFAALQGIALLVDQLALPAVLFRGAFALLILGLPATLVAHARWRPGLHMPHVVVPRRLSWRVAGTSAVTFFALIGVGATVASVTGTLRARDATWVANEGYALLDRYIETQQWDSAYAVGERIRTLAPDDPILAERITEYAVEIEPTASPSGATILLRPYHAADASWRVLGRTPLPKQWLPNGYYRYRIELDGYETRELAGPPGVLNRGPELQPAGSIPAGMVHVPSSRVPSITAIPAPAAAITLPAFLIGRYEVTNAEYRRFVEAGAYQDPRFWPHPFVLDGVVVPFGSAVRRFVDATGRVGPATWEAGDFAEGMADHPVAGLSWYEAAAYAEWAGAALPSLYEWAAAAGVSAAGHMIGIAHFGVPATRRVQDSRAMSPVGAFDMAGNVREWVHNAAVGGHFLMGGGFGDADYMFSMTPAASPWDREPANGVRLVQRRDTTGLDILLRPIERYTRDFVGEPAASDEVFDAYRRMYAYDPLPLNARIERRDSMAGVGRFEDVTYDAPYGGRARVRLLLPARPGPHPLVVWLGGSSILSRTNSDEATYRQVDFLVRSGYAVAMLVPEGTFERRDSIIDIRPSPTRRYAATVMRWTNDFSRAIDYAVTRPDVDAARIAFLGNSLGARLAPILLATEPRVRAAVLFDGGFNFRVSVPEAEPVNFVGRVSIPVLMLNGRFDPLFPYHSSQIPLFSRLGTPADRKQHIIFDAGHSLPRPLGIRETLDWLETWLR